MRLDHLLSKEKERRFHGRLAAKVNITLVAELLDARRTPRGGRCVSGASWLSFNFEGPLGELSGK